RFLSAIFRSLGENCLAAEGRAATDDGTECEVTDVYITSMGKFLPGEPVDNDSMEEYLGRVGGKSSRVRARILKQNGIQTRHYAIDREQKTLYSNAQMAAKAVREAMGHGSIAASEIDFLAAATSQGDFPLPGFASSVHAELDIPACEIATLHG